jgi:hypothetical protein
MQTSLTTAAAVSNPVQWSGGRGVLYASGTWGSGTLTLTYCETSDGTFVPVASGITLSANGSVAFELPRGYLKATLSGSTGATVAWNAGSRVGT